jgi:Domain of unknown function (DUF4180)
MNFVIASEVGLRIDAPSDVIQAIGRCYGFLGLVVTEDDVARDFFELQSGLAGELFQKCTNYQLALAVVVKDLTTYSPRILELAHEHRQHRLIRFFGDVQTATDWLKTRR